MPKKTRRFPKDDTPEWLKSTHRELQSKTSSGGETKATKIRREKPPEEHRAAALVILGVSEDDLERSPRIEHLFRDIGGQEVIFEYLGGSESPDARKLLDLRKKLTQSQREECPFEAYCLAAVLPVKKVFGLITSEAMEQEAMAKELLFRVRHTEVVKATINSALDEEFGAADRRMLHQAAGFVPVPKTSITHFHGQQINDNRIQSATVAVLPSVEDTIKRLGDRFNERVVDVTPQPVMIEAGEDEEDDGYPE